MKHDIRCKGTLSDEDLAREWIRRGTLMWTCTAYGGVGLVDRSDIEKELGKDRLEFLVFKIKTEERLEKLENLSLKPKEKPYINLVTGLGIWLFLFSSVIVFIDYFLL